MNKRTFDQQIDYILKENKPRCKKCSSTKIYSEEQEPVEHFDSAGRYQVFWVIDTCQSCGYVSERRSH